MYGIRATEMETLSLLAFVVVGLHGCIALLSVSSIPQHCYKGWGLEPLVFVDKFKSGTYADDVARQYNILGPAMKIVEVPCGEIRGNYTLVHYRYTKDVVESWLAAIDRPPRSICMDNSYEPGFKHIVHFDPSTTKARVIYTGMDHSKSDSSLDASFRNYDLCMTFVLSGFREEHSLAIAQEEENAAKGHERIDKYRFVVLIHKRKAWRIWFIARLHEYGVLPHALYTLPEKPHPCHYHSKTYIDDNSECDEVFKVSNAAIHFARVVEPHVLSEKIEETGLNEFDVKAMIPRGRVHVILESEPTSLKSGSGICLWNERVTEKTWNAISFGHPFILVGTFLSLDLVKAHGFKTFSPCINETYGAIWDEDLKLQAALDEIRRLHALSEADYDHLYTTCLRPRAQFNYKLFHSEEYRQKQTHQRLWSWGIADKPAFDMGDFRAKCDAVVLEAYNESLSQCRN